MPNKIKLKATGGKRFKNMYHLMKILSWNCDQIKPKGLGVITEKHVNILDSSITLRGAHSFF